MTSRGHGITPENAAELGRLGGLRKAEVTRARAVERERRKAELVKGVEVLMAAPAGAVSSELASIAGQVVQGIAERVLGEIDSLPPHSLASLATAFHNIKRLENSQSTSNVAVVLSPAERRGRIMELAGELGYELTGYEVTGTERDT